jgi:hypothetical protein
MEPSHSQLTQPVQPAPSSQPSQRPRWLTGLIVAVVAIVVLGLLGALVYLMISYPTTTASLRDIFIILLAFETLVIGAFLIVLIIQLQSLIVILRDQVRPILDSANQTVSTVRGTTDFVSDTLVGPIIQVSSTFSGIREAWRVLAGRSGRKPPPA